MPISATKETSWNLEDRISEPANAEITAAREVSNSTSELRVYKVTRNGVDLGIRCNFTPGIVWTYGPNKQLRSPEATRAGCNKCLYLSVPWGSTCVSLGLLRFTFRFPKLLLLWVREIRLLLRGIRLPDAQNSGLDWSILCFP